MASNIHDLLAQIVLPNDFLKNTNRMAASSQNDVQHPVVLMKKNKLLAIPRYILTLRVWNSCHLLPSTPKSQPIVKHTELQSVWRFWELDEGRHGQNSRSSRVHWLTGPYTSSVLGGSPIFCLIHWTWQPFSWTSYLVERRCRDLPFTRYRYLLYWVDHWHHIQVGHPCLV